MGDQFHLMDVLVNRSVASYSSVLPDWGQRSLKCLKLGTVGYHSGLDRETEPPNVAAHFFG
jgi:hypothetical protein